MERPRVRRTSKAVGGCPGGAAARWLGTVAIVEQLQNHVVELEETDVQSLPPAPQVRHSYCRGADALIESFDLVIQQQCVVDDLAVEVAVSHDFRSPKDLGIERIRAIHVLYGHA